MKRSQKAERLRAWRPTGRQYLAALAAVVVAGVLTVLTANSERAEDEDRVAISLLGAQLSVDTATHHVFLDVTLDGGDFPVTLTAGRLLGPGFDSVAVRSSGAKAWHSEMGVADGETFTSILLTHPYVGGVTFVIGAPCGHPPPLPTLAIEANSQAGIAHHLRFGLTTALKQDGTTTASDAWIQAFHETCFYRGP